MVSLAAALPVSPAHREDRADQDHRARQASPAVQAVHLLMFPLQTRLPVAAAAEEGEVVVVVCPSAVAVAVRAETVGQEVAAQAEH